MNETFLRTPAGICNYSLFYDVDCIIYVEGIEQKDTGESDDIYFWESICKNFLPKRKVRVKSCGGSKDKLRKILDTIILHDQKNNIYIAKDKDYDSYISSMFDHANERLLHTYGYCFENDIVNINIFKNLLCRIVRNRLIEEEISDAVDLYMEYFRKKFYWLIIADIIASGRGGKAIDKQNKTGGVIEHISCKVAPTVNRKKTLERLKNFTNAKQSDVTLPPKISVFDLCSGKILLYYLSCLGVYIIKNFSKKSPHGLSNQIKEVFFDSLCTNQDHFSEAAKQHYTNILSKLESKKTTNLL